MTVSQGIAATEPIVFDEETKQAFLERIAEEVRDDSAGALTSRVAFMRELGVKGTKGQIRAAIREQLGDEINAIYRERLAHTVLARAIHGEVRDVRYQGKVVGQEREWDTRVQELGARLLHMLDDRVEVTGSITAAIELEGRVELGFDEFLRRRAELGLGDPGGLGPAGDRRALPAASDVLPDPAAGERPTSDLPDRAGD